MDPKSSTPLDPKLQEAYNKVMGTQIPQNSHSTPPSLATPPQTVPNMPTTPSDTSLPPAVVTPPLPTPEEPSMPVSATNMETVSVGNTPTVSYDSPTPTQGFSAEKKKMKVSPVILVIGGIVFLIVYSIIWIKVFNLQVPYINP
jgi:hypothetical protein